MAYSTYYLNGSSLATATAVFTDSALTTLASDGYYSDGAISRRLLNGVLQDASTCARCERISYYTITATGTDKYRQVDNNGTIAVFAPPNGNDIMIFNPSTEAITYKATGEAITEDYTLNSYNANTGKFLISQGQGSGDAMIYDPSDDSLVIINTGESGSPSIFGGSVSAGDFVYLSAFDSANGEKVDMVNETSSNFSMTNQGGSDEYYYGVLYNGKIYWAPNDSNVISIIDTSDDSEATVAHGQGTDAYFYNALAGDKVIFSPLNADDIIILDTSDNSIVEVAHAYPSTSNCFRKAVYSSTYNKVVFTPQNADSIMILDLSDNSLEYVAHNSGSNAYGSAEIYLDRYVGFCPLNSGNFARLDLFDNSLEFCTVDTDEAGTSSTLTQWSTIIGSKMISSPSNSDKLMVFDLA